MEVFSKDYKGEHLCDVSRDVFESFDVRFNPVISKIPSDRHGFVCGRFSVKITWHQEEAK
jgi:hypothetical protein